MRAVGISRSAPLLWDLDGTLVDTGRDLALAVNRMLGEYGYAALPDHTVVGHVGKGARNLVKRCLEERGHVLSSESEVEAALARFNCHYSDCLLDSSRPYPGIETLLADLADAGRPMAVVTNKPQSFSDRILEKLDLAPHFRFVLGEGILPERKPDPAPLLHALEKCAPGTPPSEAVLIGDSWVDVRAARNAGMLSCGVAWGLGSPREARDEAPDWWVEDALQLRDLLRGESSS
jgi:phosphoglycolate phosphatase